MAAKNCFMSGVCSAAIFWDEVFVLESVVCKKRPYEYGRSIRAVAQNPRGALLQGVSVTRIGLITLVIGSAIAGISGAIMALDQPEHAMSMASAASGEALPASMVEISKCFLEHE